MDIHLVSYYIGIFILFGSHLYTIFNSDNQDMLNHSYLNIFAGMLIAYYFMNKECFFGCDRKRNCNHGRDRDNDRDADN
jgi:hypothetical protein